MNEPKEDVVHSGLLSDENLDLKRLENVVNVAIKYNKTHYSNKKSFSHELGKLAEFLKEPSVNPKFIGAFAVLKSYLKNEGLSSVFKEVGLSGDTIRSLDAIKSGSEMHSYIPEAKFIDVCEFLIENKTSKLMKIYLEQTTFSIYERDFPNTLLEKLILEKEYKTVEKFLMNSKHEAHIDSSWRREKRKNLLRRILLHSLGENETAQKLPKEQESVLTLFENFLETLSKSKSKKLFKWGIKYCEGAHVSERLVLLLLHEGKGEYVKIISKYSYEASILFKSDAIFKQSLKLLDFEDSFELGVFIFHNIGNHELPLYHVRMLCEKYLELSMKKMENIRGSINPVLVSILIADTFNKLSKCNLRQQKRLKEFACCYRDFAKTLLDDVSDTIILKNLLFGNFSVARHSSKLIDLLYEEKDFFQDLLTNQLLVDSIYNKWTGSYNFSFNFMVCSSSIYSSQIINKRIPKSNDLRAVNPESELVIIKEKDKICDQIMNNRCSNRSIYDLVCKSTVNVNIENNYVHQYKIYLKSSCVRIVINFIFFLGIFLFIYIVLLDYLKFFEPLNVMGDDFLNYYLDEILPTSFTTLVEANQANLAKYFENGTNRTEAFLLKPLDNIAPGSDTYFEIRCFNHIMFEYQTPSLYDSFKKSCIDLEVFLYLFDLKAPEIITSLFFVLLLSSNRIVQYFYERQTRGFTKIGLYYLIDLFILGVTLIGIVFSYELYKDSGPEYSTNSVRLQNGAIKASTTIIIFLLWIKFIEFVRLTRFLGLLVKCIELMILDLAAFLLILILIVLSFSSILYILYQSIYPDYGNLGFGIRQMISAMLGQFNFYSIGAVSDMATSSIIIIAYLFLTNIIMLNLLIAILSNTYQKILNKGNVEYGYNIYQSYLVYRFNKFFSAALIFPPPLGSLGIFILPILTFVREKLKINRVIVKIAYFFYLLAFFILFNIINILFAIPYSYVVILAAICKKKSTKTGKSQLQFILKWVFGGIFVLLASHFTNDCVLFFKTAFVSIDNREKMDDISDNDFKILKRIVQDCLEQNQCELKYSEFLDKFSEAYTQNVDLSNRNSFFTQHTMNTTMNDFFPTSIKKESTKKVLELEIIEARNFLKNFDSDSVIDLKRLRLYFKQISSLKRKKGKRMKRYPHFLQMVNLLKLDKVRKSQNFIVN